MLVSINDAVNDGVARIIAIGGLAGVALIHALQLPSAFDETTYLGLLFVGAIAAALILAAALTRTSSRGVWELTAALPALILIGFVLSRTSGLPGATDDVGEWREPLGLASLVAESLLVCLSAAVLASRQPAPAGERAPWMRDRGAQPGPA
jgi:hypothetical protein